MKRMFSKVKYNTKELINSNIQKLYLEYYKIKNKKGFGIEIIKREQKKDKEIIENKRLDNITDNEFEVNCILDIFTKSKVTPIISEDVIEDFYTNLKSG